MFSGKKNLWIIGGIGLLVVLVVVGLLFAYTYNKGTTAQATPKACGTVIMHSTGSPAFGTPHHPVQEVTNCFWQAYQHCQAASMQLTFMGVDAGVQHLFTIQKQGSTCALTDGAQSYNIGMHSTPTTFACTSVAMGWDGMHITGCKNEGTFVIPTTASLQP